MLCIHGRSFLTTAGLEDESIAAVALVDVVVVVEWIGNSAAVATMVDPSSSRGLKFAPTNMAVVVGPFLSAEMMVDGGRGLEREGLTGLPLKSRALTRGTQSLTFSYNVSIDRYA